MKLRNLATAVYLTIGVRPISRLLEAATMTERRIIVSYIRSLAAGATSVTYYGLLGEVADAIEMGRHISEAHTDCVARIMAEEVARSKVSG